MKLKDTFYFQTFDNFLLKNFFEMIEKDIFNEVNILIEDTPLLLFRFLSLSSSAQEMGGILSNKRFIFWNSVFDAHIFFKCHYRKSEAINLDSDIWGEIPRKTFIRYNDDEISKQFWIEPIRLAIGLSKRSFYRNKYTTRHTHTQRDLCWIKSIDA